jgi:hypothetical protein
MPSYVLKRYKLAEDGLLIRVAVQRCGRIVKKHIDQKSHGELADWKTSQPEQKCYQRVIPAVGNLRAMLLHYFHGHQNMGHRGLDAVVGRMLKYVYWMGMRADVERHIKSCKCIKDGAQPRGVLLRPEPGSLITLAKRPGQSICCDYKSLPKAEQHNGLCAVLVIVDMFSTLNVNVAKEDVTAEGTAQAIWDRWIPHYGVPEQVHADGGSAFTSKEVIQKLNALMRTKTSKITPGNPRGNGMAEKAVKRLRLALLNLVSGHPRSWPDLLTAVTLAHNTSVNPDIGIPPITMHSGIIPRGAMPLEQSLLEETPGAKSEIALTPNQWVVELVEVMADTCSLIAEARHHQKQEERALDNKEYDVLSAGEIVWYWDPKIVTRAQSERQLHNPWTGPFLVKSVSNDGRNALLKIGDATKRINLRLLRRYIVPVTGMHPTVGRGFEEGVPVQILSYKEEKGRHLYLVRYYTMEDEVQEWTSWELLPPCMVQDYLSDVKLNPYLSAYATGNRVQVWWPGEHKSFKGNVQSLHGNWARITYDDGDVGEAFINSDGTLWQAAAFDAAEEEQRRMRLKDTKDNPASNSKATKKGRPMGSKDSKPRERGSFRKGRNFPHLSNK